MNPAPGFKIEGTKASQVSELLEVTKKNNNFVTFIEMLASYEQDVKQIEAAKQESVNAGQAGAIISSNDNVADNFIGSSIGGTANVGSVSEAWNQYIGIRYVLGCPMPITKAGGADCGSSCQQVLMDLGVNWTSRYVPTMMNEAMSKGIWVNGDTYNPACGDMIVVYGDNHIIMSDGKGGSWDAGCTKGVSHHSDWRNWFNSAATGYILTSKLISESLKNKKSSKDSDNLKKLKGDK